MAIKYTPNYNKNLNNIVRNFNRKRERYYEKGYRHLPDRIYVAQLKKQYNTREELNKELNRLQDFVKNGNKPLAIEETEGGAKITSWEMNYLQENIAPAKEHFEALIEEAEQHSDLYHIARKDYLETLQRERNFLERDIKTLSPEDMLTFKRTISKYQKYNWLNERYYRGFLSELEGIMKYAGYRSKDFDEIVDKLKELNPRQFVTMYNESDLIRKIYDIADSPIHGQGLKFNTDKEDMRTQINSLMKQVDDLVKKYKEK